MKIKPILISAAILLILAAATVWSQQPVNVAQVAGASSSATNPLSTSITDGTNAMGAMANYGSAPGAVKALNVNAAVTNTVTISGSVTANAGTNLNTSALALDTSVNGILLGQASTTSGQKGPLVQCSVTTAAPTYSTAQTDPLSCNTAGGVRVDGSGVTQPISAASLPLPTGAATAANQCTSNCSVNLAQVAGTTTSTGNGTSNAGNARVNIASDNTVLPAVGAGATGSAVPANASYHGGNGSGNLTGYLNCDTTKLYDASTNGATQLVAAVSSKSTYICGFQISTSQTTAVHVKLESGTQSTTPCDTSTTQLTPNYPLQAATSTGPIGLVVMSPGFTGLKTNATNQQICIATDAAASVQALIWYTTF